MELEQFKEDLASIEELIATKKSELDAIQLELSEYDLENADEAQLAKIVDLQSKESALMQELATLKMKSVAILKQVGNIESNSALKSISEEE